LTESEIWTGCKMETSFKTEGKMELKMLLLKSLGISVKAQAIQSDCDVKFLYHLITTVVSFDMIDVLQIDDSKLEIKKALVLPIIPVLVIPIVPVKQNEIILRKALVIP